MDQTTNGKRRVNFELPAKLYDTVAREAALAGETISVIARRGIIEEADKLRVKRLQRNATT